MSGMKAIKSYVRSSRVSFRNLEGACGFNGQICQSYMFVMLVKMMKIQIKNKCGQVDLDTHITDTTIAIVTGGSWRHLGHSGCRCDIDNIKLAIVVYNFFFMCFFPFLVLTKLLAITYCQDLE
ncbi:unnamed protein product [Albugo candida]|uniref:Uncharacterized protein n=1 Tax=Albugo candida TaxID=65357 RepID=A0A024GN22_9STRA|nr:unnamed protein product [Albugo candida]|eukprot:CCI48125.1 unnamed protein product [Albugo candida]